MRKYVGVLPWVSLVWQPAVASTVMVRVMWLLRNLSWLLLIPVYLAVLALVGGLRQPDMDLLRQLVPLRRPSARFPGTPSQG